ncbi:hypothetical protein QO058_18950 [Bosea vestrisii]|uniref:hypothetical protein n=1 Tax=Bosea vestrisii TaxID=151416 RepID=UPI0024E02881|nr:hypothetical protein [Bosea vestrisii]WID94887.1 hypothetical protein QO058_18950 [Bosea vestrisii]
MRKVSRGSKPPPAGLSVRTRGSTELERVRAHMAQVLPASVNRKAFPFAVYKADSVKKRLEELFHGKCAYCESLYASQAPVDVEHYRPKGRVEGDALHPGYWWLAADWANLLPSCLDCNRRRKQSVPVVSTGLTVMQQAMQTGKQDAFPVAGMRAGRETDDVLAEGALLLDPTRDDPEDHLAFWLGDDRASGVVYPLPKLGAPPVAPDLPLADADKVAVAVDAEARAVSVRGAVSIQVYGLNRLRLVQERARLLTHLRFLEGVFLEVGEVSRNIASLNAAAPQPQLADATDRLDRLQVRILDQMQSLAEPDAPHSSVARAYLRDFRDRVASQP